MKYFTPDLVVAYGSDDTDTWREAERRWDAAGEAYEAHLAGLRGDLPAGLRRLADGYRLHDATIRAMGSQDGAFVIVLQVEGPPQPLLTLTYDLVAEPEIEQEVLPTGYRSGGPVEWQYDEIERLPGRSAGWQHSILLSNGWVVTLRCRDVRVEEAKAYWPAPRGHDMAAPWTAAGGCGG